MKRSRLLAMYFSPHNSWVKLTNREMRGRKRDGKTGWVPHDWNVWAITNYLNLPPNIRATLWSTYRNNKIKRWGSFNLLSGVLVLLNIFVFFWVYCHEDRALCFSMFLIEIIFHPTKSGKVIRARNFVPIPGPSSCLSSYFHYVFHELGEQGGKTCAAVAKSEIPSPTISPVSFSFFFISIPS